MAKRFEAHADFVQIQIYEDWTTRQAHLVKSREQCYVTWQTAPGADAVLCRRYVSTGFPPLPLSPLTYCSSLFLFTITSRYQITSRLWPRASRQLSNVVSGSPRTSVTGRHRKSARVGFIDYIEGIPDVADHDDQNRDIRDLTFIHGEQYHIRVLS